MLGQTPPALDEFSLAGFRRICYGTGPVGFGPVCGERIVVVSFTSLGFGTFYRSCYPVNSGTVTLRRHYNQESSGRLERTRPYSALNPKRQKSFHKQSIIATPRPGGISSTTDYHEWQAKMKAENA
jgi:hypothetical protein